MCVVKLTLNPMLSNSVTAEIGSNSAPNNAKEPITPASMLSIAKMTIKAQKTLGLKMKMITFITKIASPKVNEVI